MPSIARPPERGRLRLRTSILYALIAGLGAAWAATNSVASTPNPTPPSAAPSTGAPSTPTPPVPTVSRSETAADADTVERIDNGGRNQAPPAGVKAKAETADAKTATALVIEVRGSVERAEAGRSPLTTEGWTAVELGDRLAPGTQLRTGLRAHVNLQFGETTTISIRSATYASVDQFYRSAIEERVQVGLAYGTVRGGSTEGEVRSKVVVDSPVATLAKRGTEGWEIRVEPVTGRFRISLAEHGLVEAFQKLRGDRSVSRDVRPGEYATDTNIANMWIRQEIFDRNVRMYDREAVTSADDAFSADNRRGYGVVAPGGGAALVGLSGRGGANSFGGSTNNAGLGPGGIGPSDGEPAGPIMRPEGNFGTGSAFSVRWKRTSR